MAYVLWKKVKYHLLVDPGNVANASNFYNSVYGAVLKKSSYRQFEGTKTIYGAELKLAQNLLFISEGTKDQNCASQIQIELAVDVKSVMNAALGAGAQNQEENISIDENLRGIVAKVRDPFGYFWGFSQKSKQSDNGHCSLCLFPDHRAIHLCTCPFTLNWLQLVTHTPPTVKEEKLRDDILKKVYDVMSMIGEHLSNNAVVFFGDEFNGFPSLNTYFGHVLRYFVTLHWCQLCFRFLPFDMESVQTQYDFAFSSFCLLSRRIPTPDSIPTPDPTVSTTSTSNPVPSIPYLPSLHEVWGEAVVGVVSLLKAIRSKFENAEVVAASRRTDVTEAIDMQLKSIRSNFKNAELVASKYTDVTDAIDIELNYWRNHLPPVRRVSPPAGSSLTDLPLATGSPPTDLSLVTGKTKPSSAIRSPRADLPLVTRSAPTELPSPVLPPNRVSFSLRGRGRRYHPWQNYKQ